MTKVERWDNVDWTDQDDGTFSEETFKSVNEAVPSCPSAIVCDFMTKFLSNPYPIQVEIKTSNLVLDKWDKPSLQFEITMSNCEKLEHIEGVRKRLQEVLKDAVNVINDYGY